MKQKKIALLSSVFLSLGIQEAGYSKTMASLSMIAKPQVFGPCISSLMGPPLRGCMQWLANVEAFAEWEKSRRIILLGSGDQSLHIMDEKGQPLYQLSTEGRVVTESLFNEDRTMFFIGTDKGRVYGIDAFSFAPIFSFMADSKINNNLTLVSKRLVFTSSLGTIYCLDAKNGEIKWHIEQPLTVDRLRLSTRSNILPFGENHSQVIVPHAEGYVSVIDLEKGEVSKKIVLQANRSSRFLDIVAPMIWLKNHLWVASYGLGIFAVDVNTGRTRHTILENGVLELVSDGEKLFAASADALFALSISGDILWKNQLNKIESRVPRAAFPFNKLSLGAKRIFYGTPARLLLRANKLVLATSAGSAGVFDQSSGHLDEIFGNSVGFASISWAHDNNFLMVTRRGLLMEFNFDPGVNP